MNDSEIRILVVDDHTVVRKGLCALLSSSRYNIKVIGEAADGDEAVAMAQELRPDVILMDLVMPKKSGLEAILAIRRESSDARILVLTSFDDEGRTISALKAGALGYLLKDSSPDELVQAIHGVFLGQVTLPAPLARRLMKGATADESPKTDTLTRREMDVLAGITRGLSNQEIADELSISLFTVRSHVRSILNKLSISNRTQAALYGVTIGLTHTAP